MKHETILTNARVVLEKEVVHASVRIVDGLVAEIGSPTASGIDLDGDYLGPGLVELHTDNLERHMQPRPGVKWPHAAAVVAHDAELSSVGISTVFDALRIGSVVSDRRAKYGKYARELTKMILHMREAGALRISHFLHLRAEICSETLLEEFAEFGPEDRIGIVSLMDHTPGQRQFRDLSKLADYLRGKYAMAPHELDAHFAHLKGLRERIGDTHEEGAVREARRLGAALASHDDTTSGHVDVSAAHGVALAEFPTTREAAEACHARGIAVMMGAPNLLRGGSHSGNVSAGELAEAGLLDILSSDYAPSSLLAAAVRLGEEGGDLAAGLRTVTAAPARAVGLTDRGRIAPGLRADLLRFTVIEGVPVTRALWVRGVRAA
ncbi:MAG: alpha-D-ribose 1-methylphosphonate 5-triphosphate diphosphatase [Rubricella sp.]